MKKLIFATVLMLAMALASYGKPANKNNGLVKSLTTALKQSAASATFSNGEFKKTSFYFNGKTVNAFYDIESDELIGFSIPMSATDLPSGASDDIKKKFSAYSIEALMMFVDKNGFFGFYVSLSRPSAPTIVVSIDPKGKARYYGKA